MHNLKSPQNYHMIKMILAGCMNNLLKAVYFYLPRIQTNDDRQKRESVELMCDYVLMLKFIYADLAGDLITQC